MLIGIDASRAITGQRTGTEAYAYFLIQALLPLAVARGHQVRLYFNQPPPADLFPVLPGVEPVVIPFARLWTHLRLAYELRQRPCDLFFTPAHVLPLGYHGRSAATIHDLGYHYFPNTHPKQQLPYLRWSSRHNGRTAQQIFADSYATRDDLIRLDGVPAEKIKVVYPGIDPQLQPITDHNQLTAVWQKYQITPPYLLFLSTLHPRKNLVRLVRAYSQSGLATQLVLAGKTGWLTQPLQAQIAALPPAIQAQIRLTGYVDEADKAALLSGATAVLYPSLYEGFGFPILEAQACGTAVLTANSSSCPEVAGDAALLVDPLDDAALLAGLQRIASDQPFRQTLQQKGYANVSRFSWQQTAVQLLDAFEQPLNN